MGVIATMTLRKTRKLHHEVHASTFRHSLMTISKLKLAVQCSILSLSKSSFPCAMFPALVFNQNLSGFIIQNQFQAYLFY